MEMLTFLTFFGIIKMLSNQIVANIYSLVDSRQEGGLHLFRMLYAIFMFTLDFKDNSVHYSTSSWVTVLLS